MAAPTDKRASELTAPVSIEDTDTFPGYRPGTGGEPNLDIRATAGLIRAPILAALADGTASIAIAAAALAAGTSSRALNEKLSDWTSIKDFSASELISDGSTDASTAFLAAIASTRSDIFLSPGNYQLNSSLGVDMTNKRFWAVPGTVTIQGSNGTTGAIVWQLRKVLNVGFYGIDFYCTGTNATYTSTDAVVCSLTRDITNLTFDQCSFRAPGTGGQLLALYPNTLPNQALKRTLEGLRIRNCVFDGAGQHAITLMNRTSGGYSKVVSATSTTVVIQTSTLASFHTTNGMYTGLPIKIVKGPGAGQIRTISDYTVSGGVHTVTVSVAFTTTPDNTSWYEIEENSVYRMSNVWIENNTFRNLGLMASGASKIGFAVSFDGAGTGMHFMHNAIEDADIACLEMTNTFRDSYISDNTIKDNGTSLTGMGGFLLSCYDSKFSYMRNITVANNKCLKPYTTHSFFGNMEDCIFYGNKLWGAGTDGAVYFRNMVNCFFDKDIYLFEGVSNSYAMTLEGLTGHGSSGNLYTDCQALGRSLPDSGAVLFSGATCVDNTLLRGQAESSGAGLVFNEFSSAVRNQASLVRCNAAGTRYTTSNDFYPGVAVASAPAVRRRFKWLANSAINPQVLGVAYTYTGGAGLQTVHTLTIPGGMLNLPANETLFPSTEFFMVGSTAASASPTVNIQLRQGAFTLTASSTTAIGSTNKFMISLLLKYIASGTLFVSGHSIKSGSAPTIHSGQRDSLNLANDVFIDIIISDASISNAVTPLTIEFR